MNHAMSFPLLPNMTVKAELESPADEKAIDEGFDYVNFPNLTPDEQLRSIPKEFYKDIVLDINTVTRSHKSCILRKHPDNHHGSWACDKVKGASFCLKGLESFYQSKGHQGWRCSQCDFDLCISCMQADKFIEMLLSRED